MHQLTLNMAEKLKSRNAYVIQSWVQTADQKKFKEAIKIAANCDHPDITQQTEHNRKLYTYVRYKLDS